MAWITYKTIHEVERNGNLFYLGSGFIGAINRFADVLGHSAVVIAQALGAPDDSVALKTLIEKLKPSREELNAAIDKQILTLGGERKW